MANNEPENQVELLEEGTAMLESCNGHIRDGQADKLRLAVVTKTVAVCSFVQSATPTQLSADECTVITKLLKRSAHAADQQVECINDVLSSLEKYKQADKDSETLSQLMVDCLALTKVLVDSCSFIHVPSNLVGPFFDTMTVKTVGVDTLAYPKLLETLEACFESLHKTADVKEEDVFSKAMKNGFDDLLEITKRLISLLESDTTEFSVKRDALVGIKAAFDSLDVFQSLGPSADVRLQRDPHLVKTSTVPAAVKNILDAFAAPAVTPPWLSDVISRTMTSFEEVGVLVEKMRVASATRATQELLTHGKYKLGGGKKPKGGRGCRCSFP